MDSEILEENQIAAGQKLVEQLVHGGFGVSAAFWLRSSDEGKWNFYIVSPIVDAEGLFEAYQRLHPFAWAMSQPSWISRLEIKLLGPSDKLARDVLAISPLANGPAAYPIHLGGRLLGNMSVEEVYLYPLPVASA